MEVKIFFRDPPETYFAVYAFFVIFFYATQQQDMDAKKMNHVGCINPGIFFAMVFYPVNISN